MLRREVDARHAWDVVRASAREGLRPAVGVRLLEGAEPGAALGIEARHVRPARIGVAAVEAVAEVAHVVEVLAELRLPLADVRADERERDLDEGRREAHLR